MTMKPGAQRLYGILLSLLLFMAALILYSSLLVPQYQEIQELRGERVSLSALLEEEGASVAAVETLLRQYSSVTQLREALALTLPEEEEAASVVSQIQGIAASNGVLISTLSTKPLPAGTTFADSIVRPVGAVRVAVGLIGNYADIKSYLRALETNIRIMDVHSLRVRDGGESEGPYNYELEVDTYYQL